jgi:hypothetical protein
LANGASSFDPNVESTGVASAEKAAIAPAGEDVLFADLKHSRIVSRFALDYERSFVVASVKENRTLGSAGDKHLCSPSPVDASKVSVLLRSR